MTQNYIVKLLNMLHNFRGNLYYSYILRNKSKGLFDVRCKFICTVMVRCAIFYKSSFLGILCFKRVKSLHKVGY